MDFLRELLIAAAQNVFNVSAQAELTRPDEQFGDYATNIALQLASRLEKNPRDVAEQLKSYLDSQSDERIAAVDIAGPGFINIRLSDSVFSVVLDLVIKQQKEFGTNEAYKGKTVVIEHTDPNPFKEFHIGHAYSNTIGESLGRLYAAAGATVHQVSYHGDVGMHIAMAVWGIQKQLGEEGKKLSDIPEAERRSFMGKSYALGASAFKDNEAATGEIKAINKHIYARDNPSVNELYDTGRQWSFDYFEEVYERLGVSFEKQYFESETGEEGKAVVRQHLGKVFEESDGAVVYKGEKAGLHTRVFLNSEGLPTYEAKELGLAFAKERDYNFDEAVIVTANEIDEYFKVLIAALNEIKPELADKIRHVSHGVVRLPSGKMSSRSGEVITALDVMAMLENAVKKSAGDHAPAVNDNVLGALKYTFLKHRVGGDIIFDINESVSLEGNSGPYIQYAYARAQSILNKVGAVAQSTEENFNGDERTLIRKISEYPEVVESAIKDLMPHHIAGYLHELTQVFNRFYEKNRVIGDEREGTRLQLVRAYAQTLKNGLSLLNIPAPDKM